jgi:ribonuclease P protein component
MQSVPVPPPGGPPAGGADGMKSRPDQGLGRHQRIIRSCHFDEAFAQQKKAVGKTMVMWLREGEGASLRLGLITSRKVGGAVQRVRARRLLRDVFRRHRNVLDRRYDVLLVARANILRVDRAGLEADFLATARRAGLLSYP